MAPALVKQCTAKERDSISKKIFDLSYIPPLGRIVCIDQVSRHNIAADNLFSNQLYKSDSIVDRFDSFMNETEYKMPLPEVHRQYDALTNNASNVANIKAGSLEHIQQNINTITNSINSKSLTYIPNKKLISQQINHKHSNLLATNTDALLCLTKQKQTQVCSKLTDQNTKLVNLHNRLRKFQVNSLQCHLESVAPGFKTHSQSQNNLLNCIYQADISSCTEIKRIKSEETIFKKVNSSKLKKIYDTLYHTFEQETDNEGSEEDYKCRIPLCRGKKRSENSPPNSEQLYKWKRTRTEIGAKCSWLSVQISNLDKKIATISKLQSALKQERKCSTKTESLHSPGLSNEERVHNASGEVMQNIGGSIRTQPVAAPSTRHKYVRALENVERTKFTDVVCRNKPSVLSCDMCKESQRSFNNDRPLTADMLDLCYHSLLSYSSDIGLSLLMEETLRKERINTKVTITKLKKKKKQKAKLTPQPHNDFKSKLHNQYSKTTQPKPKSERTRSDELSTRKRSHVSDISTRLRKVRKISETLSYDSSKPPTPTNELSSPLPQGVGFFNKYKKKTTSGDYDINSIVIPYSMAASTRLERIQYKEIPTPGWRNIWNDLSMENGFEEELTDDDLYLERHDRCEMNEQKRLTGYFPQNKRVRTNRSSECGTTSEPPSPLMLEEIRSSYTTPVDSPSGLSNSSKLANRLANITQVAENEREASWSTRVFPLAESEAKKIDARTPAASPMVGARESTSPSLVKPLNTYSLRHSPYTLISSTSTTSKNTTKESPKTSLTMVQRQLSQNSLKNDISADALSELDVNNWTVKVMEEGVQETITLKEEEDSQRKGIVLKIAKK